MKLEGLKLRDIFFGTQSALLDENTNMWPFSIRVLSPFQKFGAKYFEPCIFGNVCVETSIPRNQNPKTKQWKHFIEAKPKTPEVRNRSAVDFCCQAGNWGTKRYPGKNQRVFELWLKKRELTHEIISEGP